MRKHRIDNLRCVTVLSVLLYHVIYFFNNKWVFGGIGWFGDFPQVQQYQDAIMYILYPRFMPLLFLLAGISARYSLQKYSGKEWFKSRTRKLLVPATIGLFVFQWMTGYFNTQVSSVAQGIDLTAGVPWIAKYIMWAISGIWPLWFIQLLWVLCLVLLIIKKIDAKDKFWNWCWKANIVVIILLGILFRLGEKTLIMDLSSPLAGLINLQANFLLNNFLAWILCILAWWSTRKGQKSLDSTFGLRCDFVNCTSIHYLGTEQFRASISQ